MPSTRLQASYAYCEHLARREAGNFFHAFHVLPRVQRRAMCALYAFMRVTDDLADGDGTIESKRVALESWRVDLHAALAGEHRHPLHPALRHTLNRFDVPSVYLEEVIQGCESDLGPVRFAEFDALYDYCYHVASAVGLACIHIWRFHGEAQPFAERAGIALQLTNILRDLPEDLHRDRLYLPAEDMLRFGCRIDDMTRADSPGFRELMRFQVERARGYYKSAEPLKQMLDAPGRAVFQVILRTYRCLLDEIEQHGYDVFRNRVRLSSWRKAFLVAQALPTRLGWR